MPLELKEQLDLQSGVFRAARRRAGDELHRQFTSQELDERTRLVASNMATTLEPAVGSGEVLHSHLMRKFVKDGRYLVGAVAEQSQQLEDEIIRASRANFAILDDVRRQTGELSSTLAEERVRVLEGYNTVHYNQFTRSRDLGLDWKNDLWLVDFANQQSFLANEIIPGDLSLGLTLPAVGERDVPINDVTVVGELTDRGDTGAPLLETSPRNLLLEGKVFRWVILRRQFDNTTRLYTREPATCTLLVTLAARQTLNTLRLGFLAHSRVRVTKLSYFDENGAEANLDYYQGDEHGDVVLSFSPVRAKKLRLYLQQDAPVTSSLVTVSDARLEEFNQLLAAAGFTQQLAAPTEEQVQGRIFDFSLETLTTSLRRYESRGIFRSQPLPITSPLGVNLKAKAVHTVMANTAVAYGEAAGVSPRSWVEQYFGVQLKNADGGTMLDALIPVPDDFPAQSEALPLLGQVSRVKLFPDLTSKLVTIAVTSATWSGSSWSVTTSAAHGLSSGTTDLVMMGPQGTGFSGQSASFTVTGSTTLTIAPASTPSAPQAITAETLPASFLWVPSAQPAIVEVYEDTTLLTLGTDYLLSVDGGQTYYSFYPAHATYPVSPTQVAGQFYVKIVNPNVGHRYSVSYTVASNQSLVSNGRVILRNGRVVFTEELADTTGAISAVLVLRGSAYNSYITPLVLNYQLRVQES